VTESGEERPQLGAVLTELSSARIPWLALACDLRTMSDATLIDLADPHVPPVTVNQLPADARRGPAGRFLKGGHPADVGCLVQGEVLVTVGGVADDEGTFFLAGVLLAWIAGRLGAQHRRDPAGVSGLRLAVVTAADLMPDAAARPWAAARLGWLHDDLRAAGAQVIVADEARGPEPHPGRGHRGQRAGAARPPVGGVQRLVPRWPAVQRVRTACRRAARRL
jgi:hypothetical protein